MKPKTTSLRWLLGTALLAASAAQATEPSTPTTDASALDAASVDNGVRAYVDPATGKLRQATPAERAEEARQSAEAAKLRKGKGVKMDKRASGAVRAIDLEGRTMESVVVTRAADGSLQYHYVTGDGSQVDPATLPKSEEK
jgi:hypothetical protein